MKKVVLSAVLALFFIPFFGVTAYAESTPATDTDLLRVVQELMQIRESFYQDFKDDRKAFEFEISEAVRPAVGIGIVFRGEVLDGKTGVMLVLRVVTNSPAEKEGLRPGDAILSVNGTAVSSKNPKVLKAEIVGDGAPGRYVMLEIISETGEKRNISLVTAEWRPSRFKKGAELYVKISGEISAMESRVDHVIASAISVVTGQLISNAHTNEWLDTYVDGVYSDLGKEYVDWQNAKFGEISAFANGE